ncbi:MAG: copper chaperone PCu(A)C [Pseudomonadota bacterium]
MTSRHLAHACAAMFLTFTSLSTPAMSGDTSQVGDIIVENPWSRATPRAAKVGAGYVTIKNTGSIDDRLVSVSSPIAGVTEIHTMSITDGVMKMRKLPDGIVIPAGESIALKPGGDHVMFMKLKAPIKTGDDVKTTLTFEKAGAIEVTFDAVKIGGTPKRGSHSGATDKKAKRGSH